MKGLLIPLTAKREENWAQLKEQASQAMDDLAVYFSGEHVAWLHRWP